jgi:hypothetical protein
MNFDRSFISDGMLGCLIWADEPTVKRVRFFIGSLVLQDVLHGGNPVHDEANIALCERERSRIEKASRRAFAERPGARIELKRADFQ